MKNFGAIALILLLTACKTTGSVSYAHNPNAVCPAPLAVSPQVTTEFQRYADKPLVQQFYKYYLQQQRDLAAFQQKKLEHCPASFWVQDSVAAEFQSLPQGHPLREFFKTYVAQQRALDAYYSPSSARAM